MKKLTLLFMIIPLFCKSQQGMSYEDSISRYLKNYVDDHEVVKGSDKKLLQFYPADPQFRVQAIFEKKDSTDWFWMSTSGTIKQQYRIYGVLQFRIKDTLLRLNLYQSKSLMLTKEYGDFLFLPFTDNTSGFDTYGAGRYIDLKMSDIHNGHCVIDFNKAYNPYCAYASGYHCPIPPRENELKIYILAGEKNYLKKH